jgi:triacylglycerol lipase
VTEQVILLHGLGRTCNSLARLRRGLEKAGFAVQCWPYPSRRRRLGDHIAALRQWLSQQHFTGPVHFAGHSLGGVIIRGALAEAPPVAVGRLVFIASPNQGAGVATRYGNWPLSRLIFGLPLQDVMENSRALQSLGVPDADIGIIAGDKKFHPVNPISYFNLLQRDNIVHDGTVELANTGVASARDAIVVPAHHTFICNHETVIQQTAHFMLHGRFEN